MIRHPALRPVLPAALAMAAAATLTVAGAPPAHAVGEHSKCTVNWPNYPATVGKNAWNLRTGPSTAHASRGYLYRGDMRTVLCSRGTWDYTQLTRHSTSGLAKGTKGWVHQDGLARLES